MVSGVTSASAETASIVAATPPMGWSSWSALRGNIAEDKIEAEARMMHDQLRNHGYLGFTGRANVRDLWAHTQIANQADAFSATLPPHGARLLRVSP